MPQIIFSLTFNPETKELTYVSNIAPPEAQLTMAQQLIQNAIVSEAVNKAKAADKAEADKAADAKGGGENGDSGEKPET